MDIPERTGETACRYSQVAEAYIDLFGAPEQAEDQDRELIAQWAAQIHGPST